MYNSGKVCAVHNLAFFVLFTCFAWRFVGEEEKWLVPARAHPFNRMSRVEVEWTTSDTITTSTPRWWCFNAILIMWEWRFCWEIFGENSVRTWTPDQKLFFLAENHAMSCMVVWGNKYHNTIYSMITMVQSNGRLLHRSSNTVGLLKLPL